MKTRAITYLTLAFILSSFILSSCEKEEIVDLIVNGNIELGIEQPYYWYAIDGYGKYSLQMNTSESYSPKNSLTISIDSAESRAYAWWGQSIEDNLPIGKAVTLKVKIKGELNGDGVGIYIRGDDERTTYGPPEQNVQTPPNIQISGSFDWTEYSITLDKFDATTKMLTAVLMYLPETTGEVYFDDISLTYLSEK